ncbi:Putative zinc- or iron-chelating domain-containing protein [Desulfonema limicola]|uniref:Zinc- or iron-chelating domain-containing protein n=1 Tax=Desulfonema limicola TaxID=45656 RepID=A0A975B8Q3_9BACT|nr:YkgJ family cysteine cluster protein [Desulfonema limicola]QTA81001.1 Putative zinc- or iron-chelating domain-containing protein [Desulfonema limicola]
MYNSLPASINQEPAAHCRQCGTCCKKGGPCFHYQDKHLIQKGIILSKYLYTIRRGEMAFDNVKGFLSPVLTDIIKIKEKDNSQECIFYDNDKGCTIYKNRPFECRALKCWDTKDIEAVYSSSRLSREDLLGSINGLWELIQEHQERCDYKIIHCLIKDITSKNKEAEKSLNQILKYDNAVRSLVVESSSIKPDMTDFLFGRPVLNTVRAFGLFIKQNNTY